MDLARIFPTAFLKGLATRPPAAAWPAERLPPRVSYISYVFTAAMPTSATWKRAFTTCPTLASLPRPRPQLRVLSPLWPHSECASSPSPAQPASGRPPAAGACTSGPPPGLSHLDLLPGDRARSWMNPSSPTWTHFRGCQAGAPRRSSLRADPCAELHSPASESSAPPGRSISIRQGSRKGTGWRLAFKRP